MQLQFYPANLQAAKIYRAYAAADSGCLNRMLTSLVVNSLPLYALGGSSTQLVVASTAPGKALKSIFWRYQAPPK